MLTWELRLRADYDILKAREKIQSTLRLNQFLTPHIMNQYLGVKVDLQQANA